MSDGDEKEVEAGGMSKDGEKEVDAGEISEGGEKEMEWKHVRFKKRWLEGGGCRCNE